MKRAAKTPKRVRGVIRAEARRRGAPIFVAEAGNHPARLLNVGPQGGELVEGLGILPGRAFGKTRTATEALGAKLGVDLSVPPEERDDHAFGDVSDELEQHAQAIDARMDALEQRGGGLT